MTQLIRRLHNLWQRLISQARPGQSPVRVLFSSLFIGLVGLLGASALISSSASHLRLEVSEAVLLTDEVFTIDVFANAKVPVNAVEVSLRYDPKVIEVLSVDKAKSVLTIWSKEPEFGSGQISFAGGTFRRGFIGEHPVVTIKARALVSGQAEFVVEGVQLLAGDGTGAPVPVDRGERVSRTSFYINATTPNEAALRAEVNLSINPDIDGDGAITLRDISSFMGAWSNQSNRYDFNQDGLMNFRDFSIILAEYFFGQ